MRRDITVGSGDRGNTATLVRAIPGLFNVSENDHSYWIFDHYGVDITIFKDTQDGRRLHRYITQGYLAEEIQALVTKALFLRLSGTEIKELISLKEEEAEKRGRQMQAEETKQILLNLIT